MPREMHVHLEDSHVTKLKEITGKIWKDQKRSRTPVESEGIRHAIDVTHEAMFSKRK